MPQKRYHHLWRILAAVISLLTAYVVSLTLLGYTHRLTWSGILGAFFVFLLLPSVAITGHVPARLERWVHPKPDQPEQR